MYAGLEWGAETKIAVFEAFYYFLDHESVDIQNATLQAIGSICIRHYDFMMDDRLKLRYITILTKGVSSMQTTTQVRIKSAPKPLLTPFFLLPCMNINLFFLILFCCFS